ncbi:hypothetical protein KM043_009161 [Ampulex compressa]|nr:hypothetical protein KM043_009161 [Ampulex compressa]
MVQHVETAINQARKVERGRKRGRRGATEKKRARSVVTPDDNLSGHSDSLRGSWPRRILLTHARCPRGGQIPFAIVPCSSRSILATMPAHLPSDFSPPRFPSTRRQGHRCAESFQGLRLSWDALPQADFLRPF